MYAITSLRRVGEEDTIRTTRQYPALPVYNKTVLM
jgi:hypothetical protein